GGALLWVAAVSILFQVVYNIEISRYALYTGEPIFTGKFRIPPHPLFWVILYLMLDWGSVAPYLAVNAAVPLESLMLGRLPDAAKSAADWWLHKGVCTGLYLTIMLPLIFGGKIYNALKIVMAAKLVIIFGFLIILGILFARPTSWVEIATGFLKVGTVPVKVAADSPPPDAPSADKQAKPLHNTENVFVTLFKEGRLPKLDWTLIAVIAGLAAIAGNGGLTNAPISNFTRDQGWGMGHHVGAIPSVVGGHGISLSHVGCVFEVTPEALPRWRRWVRHIARDQLVVWMGACFIGCALPSILSVGFLPRGTDVNQYTVAAMTAGAVQKQAVEPMSGTLITATGLDKLVCGPNLGKFFWGCTLFCGFLVLITSQTTTMDGFVRRWVDVIWTASPQMRQLDTSNIRYVYFTLLCIYAACGLAIMWGTETPLGVFKYATTGYNFAFAFSAWHTIAVNTILLPPALRPGWLQRIGLFCAGLFFFTLGTISVMQQTGIAK
ncbi:MAG: Nramp family divalent metal transporter, partial [Planctomycetia bacterium]|nr:Nramp family divalent metal transporter [Planctomycetia bacterium]